MALTNVSAVPFVNFLLSHFVNCVFGTMSLVKSVVEANDDLLVNAHKSFVDWKENVIKQNPWKPAPAKTSYGWALLHFRKCGWVITRACTTLVNQHAHANNNNNIWSWLNYINTINHCCRPSLLYNPLAVPSVEYSYYMYICIYFFICFFFLLSLVLGISGK